MAKKPKTLTNLKKDAWNLCSKYIRQSSADWRGYATCVTCGVTKQWKELQAGHFVGGRNNALLFDERGIHCQCYGCNVCKSGNIVEYFRFMQQKYGKKADKVIDELRRLSKTQKTFTRQELEDLIQEYKNKINDLQ